MQALTGVFASKDKHTLEGALKIVYDSMSMTSLVAKFHRGVFNSHFSNFSI